MGISYSHKFGQIIGDLLELAIEPKLQEFAKRHGLYLDKKGERAARSGLKVTWVDGKYNKHDLDFVIERNGSEGTIGDPVAFIEAAWRRYTRHSKNKAQEIQGAIVPLLEKYHKFSPFAGVILAGEFTSGSLTQLHSLGFGVLHFPHETVFEAFAKSGIDARYDEGTPEEEFLTKIESWNNLNDKSVVAIHLLELNYTSVVSFFKTLENSIGRVIERIILVPLHGQQEVKNSIKEAIEFIDNYSLYQIELPLVKFEIIIKYNNGDRIEAFFNDKKESIKFLLSYL